jgi:hypothetical protein
MEVKLNLSFYGFTSITDAPHKRTSHILFGTIYSRPSLFLYIFLEKILLVIWSALDLAPVFGSELRYVHYQFTTKRL